MSFESFFDAAVPFWNSEEGLLERIGLLADQVQFGTYNGALKVIATSVGAADLRISGDITRNTCEWCALHVGQVYEDSLRLNCLSIRSALTIMR